jgi:hypothetical protein
MIKQFNIKLLALPIAVALTGCATIVGTPNQLVPIASTPSDAQISITDESGAEVFKGQTPTSVTLQKSTGRYWGKKDYKVTITKVGFKPQIIPITAAANGWYMFGNLAFGGLIGYFAVDPFNGNMYTLSPENISATLPESTAHNNSTKDGSISIVLLQDVPENLKSKLVRIH